MSFKTCCVDDLELSKARIEACIFDITLWMVRNRLTLNQDNAEVLVFSSSQRPKPGLHDLTIVEEIFSCS